jgi:hypothetical protein
MEHIKMVDRASKKRHIIDFLIKKYDGRFRKKNLRAHYSEYEKTVISAMLLDAQGNFQLVADACRIGGFCSLDRSTVRRINKGRTPRNPRGKPVNHDFEKLVFSSFMSQSPSGNSISMLQIAAHSVLKNFPEYRKCPVVQRLQFSRKWANGFFHRHCPRSNPAKFHDLESHKIGN